jgi:hypothetical protein
MFDGGVGEVGLGALGEVRRGGLGEGMLGGDELTGAHRIPASARGNPVSPFITVDHGAEREPLRARFLSFSHCHHLLDVRETVPGTHAPQKTSTCTEVGWPAERSTGLPVVLRCSVNRPHR